MFEQPTKTANKNGTEKLAFPRQSVIAERIFLKVFLTISKIFLVLTFPNCRPDWDTHSSRRPAWRSSVGWRVKLRNDMKRPVLSEYFYKKLKLKLLIKWCLENSLFISCNFLFASSEPLRTSKFFEIFRKAGLCPSICKRPIRSRCSSCSVSHVQVRLILWSMNFKAARKRVQALGTQWA